MGQGGDINMMIKQYDIISILGGGGNVGDMWVIYIYVCVHHSLQLKHEASLKKTCTEENLKMGNCSCYNGHGIKQILGCEEIGEEIFVARDRALLNCADQHEAPECIMPKKFRTAPLP